ncbi:hypothetical protein VNO77_33989 [Canavalia gladiata]|uniref:Uncharacterized protein n=1 Tax=Canavalia gladiata TaxID=3824 RepID=A0AAN9KFZ2_CANGL
MHGVGFVVASNSSNMALWGLWHDDGFKGKGGVIFYTAQWSEMQLGLLWIAQFSKVSIWFSFIHDPTYMTGLLPMIVALYSAEGSESSLMYRGSFHPGRK